MILYFYYINSLTIIKKEIPKLKGNPGELVTNSKKERDYVALPTSTLKFHLLHTNYFRPTFSLWIYGIDSDLMQTES